MITTVTYRGRIVEVKKFTLGWWARIIPRVDISQLLERELKPAARTPVEARKRAKLLIDEQDRIISGEVKSYA